MTLSGRRAVTYDGITYAPGAQFRVIGEGATLHGMVPTWSGASSWKQQLQPGEELTCTGWGPGFGSDPGYGVEFTSAESDAARAIHCHINPMVGGTADYRPASGVLTSVDAPEDAGGSAPN